jgi:hypothetical protein
VFLRGARVPGAAELRRESRERAKCVCDQKPLDLFLYHTTLPGHTPRDLAPCALSLTISLSFSLSLPF